MWNTQFQVDTWVNLANGKTPDHWIRSSSIEQIRMTKDCEFATVVLKGGAEIISGYTANQLVQLIADSKKELK